MSEDPQRARRHGAGPCVAGDEAFVAKVRVAALDDLDRTLRVLRQVPGIVLTRTTVVLSRCFEGRRRGPSA